MQKSPREVQWRPTYHSSVFECNILYIIMGRCSIIVFSPLLQVCSISDCPQRYCCSTMPQIIFHNLGLQYFFWNRFCRNVPHSLVVVGQVVMIFHSICFEPQSFVRVGILDELIIEKVDLISFRHNCLPLNSF